MKLMKCRDLPKEWPAIEAIRNIGYRYPRSPRHLMTFVGGEISFSTVRFFHNRRDHLCHAIGKNPSECRHKCRPRKFQDVKYL